MPDISHKPKLDMLEDKFDSNMMGLTRNLHEASA